MSHSAGRSASWLRRGAALASAAGLMILTALVPAAAATRPAAESAPAAKTSTHAGTSSGGTTVTGPKMWDPKAKAPYPNHSSVTVSQTTDLVNQFVDVSWTGFTPSNNEGGIGYQPTSLYPVEVAECSGTAPTSLAQCYGGQGTLQQTFGAAGPTNEVYGLTSKDGTGHVPIQIETGVENSILGCDTTHQCSLVVLPVDGGDAGLPPPVDCGNHTRDTALFYDWASTSYIFLSSPAGGLLDGCAWSDRIVVPLHFAPTPNSCGFSSADFTVAGSPMLARAMTSWDSALCLGKNPVNISYSGNVSEPSARSYFLDGANDVALTTEPATGTGKHPFTYAPVAITATSVAYWLDNPGTAQPYTSLKLTPRLVTKLVTTSYNSNLYGCTPQDVKNPPQFPGCDDAVEHNPRNIFSDPDFKALNKGIQPATSADQSDFPTVLSGNSDMTWEVTRWIAASQDAMSFLDGAPDPWTMHVNNTFLGTQMPEEQFNANDPFEAWTHEYSPVYPLEHVVTYQADNWDPGISIQPDTSTTPPSYPANTLEYQGSRDLFAILDQADAAADDMPVAALLNHAGQYVTPTVASMTAAVGSMTRSSAGTLDDSETTTSKAAYPLTMVVYAMVPTGGVSHQKAAKIAQWLDYVAGSGQRPGFVPGELPPGDAPLTAALRAQTLKAASEVLHQTGNHPSSQHGGGGGNGGGGGSAGGSSGPGSKSPSTGAGKSSAVSAPGSKTNAAFSSPDSSATGRLVLPILLVVGALLALAGPSALVLGRPGGRAAAIAGWRRVTGLRKLPASLLGRTK